MRRLAFGGLFLWMLFACTGALALTAVLPVNGGTVEVCSAETHEGTWLFLPSFADLSALGDLQPLEDEEGVWVMDSQDGEIRVMKSQNLRAVFLFSDDPEKEGREYIESDPLHDVQTTGSIAVVAPDGRVDYAGRLRQIRGRGNSTWECAKRPYQIKLEDKYDLLHTGDPAERNRTWLLLADALDLSLLHNRIALDLARELGLEEAGHCEHVDLYYDGHYRGTYLLTEKVEVGEGRVDEADYGDLIEKWNRWIGQNDLDGLAHVQAYNSIGDPISYVQGVADNGVHDAGSYLLEMHVRRKQPAAKSGFVLDGNRTFRLKNPQYASRDMVDHVSVLLGEGLRALQNGGTHPQTRQSLENWFDLESFARTILLYELTANRDAFMLNSTYFVLPAGQTQFRAGPVWDFDRSMRLPEYRSEAGYTWGLKNVDCWAEEFYAVPAFMKIVQRVYEEELYPLITQVLLGEDEGWHLMPLKAYVEQIRPSALMNERLWPPTLQDVDERDETMHYADSFDADTALLEQFFRQHNEWLYQTMVHNGEADADHVNLTMRAEWGYVEDGLEFYVFPWSKVQVQSCTHEQLAEATEEDYALWQAELILAPQAGHAFENPQVWINNGRFTGEIQPDGTLKVVFVFEDLSYRPFEYEGEDIGLIFDPDCYAWNYPSVAEMCENDPELLAEHFCYEGMLEGYVGNGFFDPRVALICQPRLEDVFGEDWSLYYWDFLYYGYEEEAWLKPGRLRYAPPIVE